MTEPKGAHWPDWRAATLLVPALAFQALRKIGSIYDSDTWWHLATGRLILEQKAIPQVDPFSWTAAGEAWQLNGWLSDVFLAVLERIGGLPLVALLRPTFMVLIGIVVFVLSRRSGAGSWAAVAAASLAVFFAEPFIVERPQLFSFVLLPVVVMTTRSGAAWIESGADRDLWCHSALGQPAWCLRRRCRCGRLAGARLRARSAHAADTSHGRRGSCSGGVRQPALLARIHERVVCAVGLRNDQRMAALGPGRFERLALSCGSCFGHPGDGREQPVEKLGGLASDRRPHCGNCTGDSQCPPRRGPRGT